LLRRRPRLQHPLQVHERLAERQALLGREILGRIRIRILRLRTRLIETQMLERQTGPGTQFRELQRRNMRPPLAFARHHAAEAPHANCA